MKKVLFITGTRADFGKIKSLINGLEVSADFSPEIFITGMHTLVRYGKTEIEVLRSTNCKTHVFYNQKHAESMDIILANTIQGLSSYVNENRPDLIVVHGDRVEALAGAIVGSTNNILVAHIEGGERSGTVDEVLRHAVSKLSHMHFVANDEAQVRLMQMGEDEKSIFVIGSPDIDIMLSSKLPALSDVKSRYEISFNKFAIAMFHPVTTEIKSLGEEARLFVDALLDSHLSYVVIYPNNDHGSELIFEQYKRLGNSSRFRLIPSMRFEYFLTALKSSLFIVGNSSAGIREAPVYGIPTINIGSRQFGRFAVPSVINCECHKNDILDAIGSIERQEVILSQSEYYGEGQSCQKFLEHLSSSIIWSRTSQKIFIDRSIA